ncbi:MAG: LysR family transcriptional regulator [Pseudomonadota bacterium]
MHTELPDLHIFARVAEAESFQQAAQQMRMARSSVSTRIGRLEKELGVTLFNRSTRRISLTDAGRTLYEHWQTIALEIGDALAAVRGADQTPMGRLRVSMPSSLGAILTPALVAEFLRDWPELTMSLDFREQHVDVVGKGFDAVIRVAHKLPDSRLTARRLITTQRVLVASPRYLKQHGTPRTVKDLAGHSCLGLGFRSEERMTWAFQGTGTQTDIVLKPAFAANNDLALILVACLGHGILHAPRLLIESEIRFGRLKVIELDGVTGHELGVFAVYPQPKPPAKVKVFVEFVDSCLSRLAETDRWAPLQTSGRYPLDGGEPAQ